MVKRTFKDFLAKDINDVFFNSEEFAEELELDGVQTLIIVDVKDSELNNDIPREQYYASQEVYKKIKTIHVRLADFYIPKIGSTITLDSKEYSVDECEENFGVLKIVLGSYES